MLIRSHKTTLIQIICKHSLNSQVIFKSIKVADDTLFRNYECEWVNEGTVYSVDLTTNFIVLISVGTIIDYIRSFTSVLMINRLRN